MRLEHHLTTVLRGEAARTKAPDLWSEALGSPRAMRAGERGDGRTGYLEVRLSKADDERVDLLTHISARRKSMLSSFISASDDWDALRAFCAEWTRPGSPLADVVGLWLEYDDAGAAAEAAPNAHFSLVPYALRVSGQLLPYGTSEWEKVEYGAALLGAEPRHFAEFAARTLGMPTVYVGVMTARTPTTLKGYLVIHPDAFERACDQLGWRDITRVFGEFRHFTDGLPASEMYVDFTLDAQGTTQLAIVFPQQYVQAGESPHRSELLERLVKVGYCNRTYAEFLSSWSGQSTLGTHRGYGQRVKRWLDLKVTYGATPYAKAYLGVDTRNITWTGTE